MKVKLKLICLVGVFSILCINYSKAIEIKSRKDFGSGPSISRVGSPAGKDSYCVVIGPGDTIKNIEYNVLKFLVRNYFPGYDVYIRFNNQEEWLRASLEGNGVTLRDRYTGESVPWSPELVGAGRYNSFMINCYPVSAERDVVNHREDINGITDNGKTVEPEAVPTSQNPLQIIKDVCETVYDAPDDVSDAPSSTLGEWEAALMAALYYRTEVGSFGCFKDTLQADAEEAAVTIKYDIDRWHRYVGKLNKNVTDTDSNARKEAEKFGAALISTIALEYFRAGEETAQSVLNTLVPGYLQELNKGDEPVVCAVGTRLDYAGFLASFLPQDYKNMILGGESMPRDFKDICVDVANNFYTKYASSSSEEQFLAFASFGLPYIGLKDGASGYCPIFDMREKGGLKIFSDDHSEQGFKLNTNWGMNTYSYLEDYFNNPSILGISLPLKSYFASR